MPDRKTRTLTGSSAGQTLVFVMMLAAVLTLLGMTMVSLFRKESILSVRQNCVMQKQELASMALEQVIYKLQQGDNWYKVGLTGMANYNGYGHEFEINSGGQKIGNYKIHLTEGNLFFTTLSDPYSRQAKQNFRTVGIKVNTARSNCSGSYYAVIERMKLSGPLLSKGKIDIPCIQPANLVSPTFRANFFWGDIFSGNTMSGYCRIPDIDVGRGTTGWREQWLPKVFAKNDIYTHINNSASGNWIFGYTYNDMSPTANAHPFSEFADVPDIDFEWYKGQAKKQGSYYGPGNIAQVSQANVLTLMSKLKSQTSVLYIDTTDGLPVRGGSTCNTYSGSLTYTANTLNFYVTNSNQYMTQGTCIIMGPLVIKGDTPSNITYTGGYTWNLGSGTGTNADRISNISPPGNWYFPQNTDGYHYVRDTSNPANSKLTKVKHYGLMYVNGELRIGGPRVGSSTSSNVCIYGTVYIGENGSLTMDTSNDSPVLFVYNNMSANLFGSTGNSMNIISFNESTFLVPTYQPDY
ncbi:MAG: hypothetical protein LLG37_06725 [Spirochaetia bacterium]|nr:hypothetical protein [Spirochaetia bacterium]